VAPWFNSLIAGILRKEKDIIDLMDVDPFPQASPQFIRALVYDYKFNTRDSKDWWIEKGPIGTYYETTKDILMNSDQK